MSAATELLPVSAAERTVLRDLARRVADAAATPENAARREDWKRHNRLERVRPMILIFPEGAGRELIPWDVHRCASETARRIEDDLRFRLYFHEHWDDDNTIEAEWVVPAVLRNSGWGLEPRHVPATAERGSWTFDPVLKEPADLKKLRIPRVEYDEKATENRFAFFSELFGDLLDVRRVGVNRISYHLTKQYSDLRGLEEMMLDMYEEPGLLHNAMAFFVEAHQSILRQYIDANLLSLNNDRTYHSSGGNGYTDELPAAGFDPERVRPCDLWASAEAQELAQVSPEQHAEFCLQYERQLLQPFGLNGYGCCEDLTRKLDDVLTLPNIRRISISPWANVPACAEKIGRKAIVSLKPNPSMLVGRFDEARVGACLREAMEATRKNVVEIILKDTHTCEHRPDRFDRWCAIARELADQYR